MPSRVWTLERDDAVGIFLNLSLIAKRSHYKNARVNMFDNMPEARRYLQSYCEKNSGYDINRLRINRLLYKEKR